MTKHRGPSGRMRRMVRVGALAGVAVLAAGCFDASGGGWLEGAEGPGTRATFGVEASCDVVVDMFGAIGVGTVELSYIDREAGVNVKVMSSDASCFPDAGLLSGDAGAIVVAPYEARPRGEGGTATVSFFDTGESGPSKGDRFEIVLEGGVHDGYSNDGILQGGNLTVTPVTLFD